MNTRVTHRNARALLHGHGEEARTPIGSFHKALHGQERAFVEWLIGEVPEGSTVAEFLVSVAVDAYNEETGQ